MAGRSARGGGDALPTPPVARPSPAAAAAAAVAAAAPPHAAHAACRPSSPRAEVFERRRHYGVPVHWARHPDLEEYVRSVAASLRDWIEQGTVEKVALVIHHGSARVALERHVVSLQLDAATPGGSIPDPWELEPALRAFLLKLAVLDAPLRPLPPDCSFEVIAYTKKLPDGVGGAGSDVVWIPAEGGELSDLQVLPVKSLRSGILNMQMYVEQPRSGTNAQADFGT
eukprot:SM000009S23522  [mRNA]  locus=s9:495090:496533:+ [translate_table: standard]